MEIARSLNIVMNIDKQSIQNQPHHLLVIEGQQCHVMTLEEATYRIGRDTQNDIVLCSDTISRHHALLQRLKLSTWNQHQYQLIDGDPQGRLSTNGVMVNGERCHSHVLSDGDCLSFSGVVKAYYRVGSIDEIEITNLLADVESKQYQSKSVQMDQPIYLSMNEYTSIMLGSHLQTLEMKN